MTEKLLTVAEVAEYLGVAVELIYRWNTAGTGPARIRVGRTVRYRPSDVEAWLTEHTVSS